MKALLIIILIFFLSFGLGQWLKSTNQKNSDDIFATENIFYSSCDVTQVVCVVKEGPYEYQLSFEGQPSPLTPFYIDLKIKDPQPLVVEASFEMSGMDMGYNTHQLIKQDNTWRAKVLLPVCSLGRNDWTLKILLKFTDKSHLAEFKFTQVNLPVL